MFFVAKSSLLKDIFVGFVRVGESTEAGKELASIG